MPAFELIATIANAGPGRERPLQQPPARLDHPPLPEAGAASNEALLLLDIQPGRGDFMTEVERLSTRSCASRTWAWRSIPSGMSAPIGVPGEEIGSVDADEVNEVSRVSAIARRSPRPAAEASGGASVHRGDDRGQGGPGRAARRPRRPQRGRLRRPAQQGRPSIAPCARAARSRRFHARLQALLPGGLRSDVPRRSARAAARRRTSSSTSRRARAPAQEPVRRRPCLLATIGPCAPLTH